jgi:hypothetical protein
MYNIEMVFLNGSKQAFRLTRPPEYTADWITLELHTVDGSKKIAVVNRAAVLVIEETVQEATMGDLYENVKQEAER